MTLRMLLAVDGSSYSAATTRVAIQLARVTGARLTAVHVVAVVSHGTGNVVKDIAGRLGFEPMRVNPEVEARHLELAEVRLSHVRTAARDAGVECDPVLVQGSVVDEMIQAARHVDLVVMGMRGAGEDATPGGGGGHIDRMCRELSVPLVLVPRECQAVDALSIGYDGSEAAARALGAVRMLVSAGLKVPVHAMHVGDGAHVLSEVDAQLQGADVRHHTLRASGTVHETLAQRTVALGADLLAVGFTGHNRWKDLLVGSAAEHLIESQTVGLLLAR